MELRTVIVPSGVTIMTPPAGMIVYALSYSKREPPSPIVVVTCTPPGGAIVLTTMGPRMPKIGLAGVDAATVEGRATTVIVYLRSADSETSEQLIARTMAATRRIMNVSCARRTSRSLDRLLRAQAP